MKDVAKKESYKILAILKIQPKLCKILNFINAYLSTLKQSKQPHSKLSNRNVAISQPQPRPTLTATDIHPPLSSRLPAPIISPEPPKRNPPTPPRAPAGLRRRRRPNSIPPISNVVPAAYHPSIASRFLCPGSICMANWRPRAASGPRAARRFPVILADKTPEGPSGPKDQNDLIVGRGLRMSGQLRLLWRV